MIFTRELGGFSAEKTTERDHDRRETDQDASHRLEENSERFPSLRRGSLRENPEKKKFKHAQSSCVQKPAKHFPTHDCHSLKWRDKTRVADWRESRGDVKNFNDWLAHVCLHVLLMLTHQMIGSQLILALMVVTSFFLFDRIKHDKLHLK